MIRGVCRASLAYGRSPWIARSDITPHLQKQSISKHIAAFTHAKRLICPLLGMQ